MLVLGIAAVAALVIPLVTLGSYKRLFAVEFHWGRLLAAGLAIQIGLEWVSPPRRYWHSIGFGLLVASYVLILGFVTRNLLLRGMSIVLIGIACNALVIVLNQGMPVDLAAHARGRLSMDPTVKHHPQQHGEKLLFLSDIIILSQPYDTVMSFGDLILAVGLCDVAYNASRDPRRRRRKTRRAVPGSGASSRPAVPSSSRPAGPGRTEVRA